MPRKLGPELGVRELDPELLRRGSDFVFVEGPACGRHGFPFLLTQNAIKRLGDLPGMVCPIVIIAANGVERGMARNGSRLP